MESNISKLTIGNIANSDIQSPSDEELRCLTNKEGPISPEPRYEAEIENAAKGGARFRSGFSESESGGSDQGRGPSLRDSPARITELASPDYHKSPIPNQSELQATSFRLQLGGLLAGHTKPIPGSGLISRKDSGCSTPLSLSSSFRAEHLEYPCANFVQCKTPGLSRVASDLEDIEDASKMTIICHYNPIMDEYVSLTDELESPNNKLSAEADEIDCLFELCKEDFPFITSKQQTINIGKFLTELEKTGIRRNDKRLNGLVKKLEKILDEEGSTGRSLESLVLNKEVFRRVIQSDFQLISKAFKNQLIIPEFPDFCKVIKEIYEDCKQINTGNVASYIPQLARYDPSNWAVSICTVDGQRYSLGNVKTSFTLQSCSKPFTYAVCLNELGSEIVHQYVGQEPSGRMFNNLSLDFNNKPHNPLLNSGAIMSSALLLNLVKPEMPMSEKFDLVMQYFGKMAGGEDIGFNNSVFLSERDTADRNFALAYFMKENKCFPKGFNLQECLDFYFQTCSMEVNCESLSVFGACLANEGTCPTTEEKVLSPHVVRDVLSLMHSCGMYNYSGQFAFKVGLPAKSGVSGALVLVVPGVMGIGLWSPPLDALGNTVRGVSFAEKFIERFNFHRFDNLVHLSSKLDPRKHRYDVQKQSTISLLYSATTGDVTALRRFHAQGLDMSQQDYDKRTALHLASAEGHSDCVQYLVENCKVSLTAKDRWGFTPLIEAHRFHHKKVVNFLVKHMQDFLPDELEYSMKIVEEMRIKELSRLSIKQNEKEDDKDEDITLQE